MKEVTTNEILEYLKENVPTKSEVMSRDELVERFEKIDERFEKIDEQFKQVYLKIAGTDKRIDYLADAVAPVKKLIPLITEDFYRRFVELEAKVKTL